MEPDTPESHRKSNQAPKQRTGYRLAFGGRSLSLLATGRKTSMLVSATRYPWIRRARRGQRVHAHRIHHQGGGPAEGVMTIVNVCRHSHLDEVEPCGRHNPSRIDPNHPNWEWVLGNARTNGQQNPIRMSERKQQKNAASAWVVIDFTYDPLTSSSRQPTGA